MMGMFLVANHPALILFDSGASHTFISKKFVEQHCISYHESKEGFKIHSPGGQIFTREVAYQVPVTLAGRDFPTNMIVLKGRDIDVILGMNWLARHKATLKTDQRTIRLSHNQEEILLSIPIPTKTTGRVYETIILAERDFPTNMIVLKGQDIDVILGMNWLARHKATLNTDQRTIRLSHNQEEILLSIPFQPKLLVEFMKPLYRKSRIFRWYASFPMSFPRICPDCHLNGR